MVFIMEKQPLVSIVTPVYNVERFLPQCIDSVLAQTLNDWELILIDDGSTDGSGAVCDRYAAADPRIRVVHKKNGGQAESRNIGISMARAELIGFVDSDDWIEPRMYEVLYDALVKNGADISICGYFMSYVGSEKPSMKGDKEILIPAQEALNKVLDDKEIKSYIWDKLFKRELLVDKFPESYYYEDYSTLFKWFANAGKVVVRELPLYHYRQRAGSTDHDVDPRKKYHFFLAEQERCRFLKSKGMFPERSREFQVKVVRTAIQEIKGIAREAGCGDNAMKYIERIRADIQQYLPVKMGEIGVQRYIRLVMLQHSLGLYLKTMRAERHVVSSGASKNMVFYE